MEPPSARDPAARGPAEPGQEIAEERLAASAERIADEPQPAAPPAAPQAAPQAAAPPVPPAGQPAGQPVEPSAEPQAVPPVVLEPAGEPALASEAVPASRPAEPPLPEATAPEVPEEPDWKEQYERARNQLLRVAADFDNFKKRTQRDLQNAAHRGREEVLEGLLPVLDNMGLAVDHAASRECVDAESLLEGVRLVLRSFQGALERFEVRAIQAVGLPFDPTIHEAMSVRETSESPPGVVLEEFRRGYMMGDRLVRPSMVVVSRGPAVASEAPPGHAPPSDEDSKEEAPPESPLVVDSGSGHPEGSGHPAGESPGAATLGDPAGPFYDTRDPDGK